MPRVPHRAVWPGVRKIQSFSSQLFQSPFSLLLWLFCKRTEQSPTRFSKIPTGQRLMAHAWDFYLFLEEVVDLAVASSGAEQTQDCMICDLHTLPQRHLHSLRLHDLAVTNFSKAFGLLLSKSRTTRVGGTTYSVSLTQQLPQARFGQDFHPLLPTVPRSNPIARSYCPPVS